MNASGNSNETLSDEQKVAPSQSWETYQNVISEDSGLAILLVDGEQPPALAVSYNNSICRMMQSSEMHEHLCQPYCGKAFENAINAGKTIAYRCHAGLQCLAAPLKTDENLRPLVAIIGRAFVKTSDYRALTERVFTGDLQDLPAEELLQNVLLANSQNELESVAVRLQSLGEEEEQALFELTSQLNTNFQQLEYVTEPKEVVDVETVETVENVEKPANIAPEKSVEFVEDVKSLAVSEEIVSADNPQTVEKIGDTVQVEIDNDEDLLSEVTRTLPDPRNIGLALESLSNVLRGAKNVEKNEVESSGEAGESVENKSPYTDERLTVISAKTENDIGQNGLPQVTVSDEPTVVEDIAIVENEEDKTPIDNRQSPVVATNSTPINFSEIADDLAAWQNFTGSLMRQTFREASVKTLQFLAGRFRLNALAWLEKWEDWLQATLATGRLQNEPMRIGLEITDGRLREAMKRESSVRLEKRLPNGEVQIIELFPLSISDEIKAAIVIGDVIENEEMRVRIARFCRNVTLQIEVLRLRE
ncbi:MAG: PocR ligand-binding domain-containing protein [Pyrinomonadaceae bacterium]|nr:PocR ligand-binding domain-containing protein [Pyrinomonadaceae bacterium]